MDSRMAIDVLRNANLGGVLREAADYAIKLLEAQEQGRLVVLPCRPAGRPGVYGSDLYIVEDGEIIDETLYEVIVANDGMALCTFENSVYAAEELGKTVFLTKEDAEAALRGVETEA